jgi:hypothetical protein
MKITVDHIKKCLEEDEDFFIDYLNTFKGDNVYQKFLTILKSWEKNVSFLINFNIEDKNLKIPLDYLIKELDNFVEQPTWFQYLNMRLLIDIPSNFVKDLDVFSVSNFIKKIQYKDVIIDFSKINEKHKNDILTQLPADLYNKIILFLINIKDKKIILSNPSLNNMEINFLTSLPYQMVKGLFFSYDMDYFRDIIYHLSKKIDGNILMNSTIMDIDYYIDKLKNDNNVDSPTNLY